MATTTSTPTLWLYIIQLEQGKYFLYDTYCLNEFEVLVTAHMKYDYLKKYKPKQISEILLLEDRIEMLYYLKKYMAKYGIDSVRGGPYKNEYLSEQEEGFLEKELAVENEDSENQEKEDIIKEIIYRYGMKHWSQIEINNEVLRLETRIESYRKDSRHIKELNWVNESILYDIEWIRKLCSHNNVSYLHIYKTTFYEKYNRIIARLKRIMALYEKYGGMGHIGDEMYVFLKYPEFFFDRYIPSCILKIENKVSLDNPLDHHHDKMNTLCDKFVMMVNTLINRHAEYQFHIEEYEKHIEWKTERIIYFLKNYSRTII